MYVERFENISKDDIGIAGGKGANLGELTQAGIPVPPGFVITAETYQKFMDATGIFQTVMDILSKIDINDTNELQDAAEEIKQIIIETPIPEDISTLIIEAYNALSQRVGVDDADVAIRSSATIVCTSNGITKEITSPFFHSLVMGTYPLSVCTVTLSPLTARALIELSSGVEA